MFGRYLLPDLWSDLNFKGQRLVNYHIDKRSNTKNQSPINTKSCTENEYANAIQKVPEQNFGAFKDH